MLSKKRIIAVAASGLAQFCNWKTRTDYVAARETLMSWSPKPKGHCFGENTGQIMYDLQIIIPAYNVEGYIKNCLESLKPVLNSRHKILIQIVDDGSTDETGAISDRFAKETGESVTVIHQKNIGLAGARNTALKAILGEYVMLLDSDDYLPEDIAIDHILDTVKGYDILQGDYKTVDSNGHVLSQNKASQLSGYAWGKLYHHTVFKEFQFPGGYWFEDTPIKFLISRMDLKIKKQNEFIYCYRKNPDGITAKSLNQRKSLDSYWVTELCLEEMPAFGIKYDQRSYDNLLNQSILNLKRIRKQPQRIRKAMFVLTNEVVEKYFPDMGSAKYAEIDNAIRNRQFAKYELLAIADWCSQ